MREQAPAAVLDRRLRERLRARCVDHPAPADHPAATSRRRAQEVDCYLGCGHPNAGRGSCEDRAAQRTVGDEREDTRGKHTGSRLPPTGGRHGHRGGPHSNLCHAKVCEAREGRVREPALLHRAEQLGTAETQRL
jgi:hypothetical protein